MPALLSPDDFPHIVERILHLVDDETKVAARLVSFAMRELADRALCNGSLEFATLGGELRVHSKWGRTLPAFHPEGSLDRQRSMIRHCTSVTIESGPPRLTDLLSVLDPASSVKLLHAQAFDGALQLPKIAELTVVMGTPCRCTSRSPLPLQHEASTVRLELNHLPFRTQPDEIQPACSLLGPLIAPTVTRLFIFFVAPGCLEWFVEAGADFSDRNPQLQVIVSFGYRVTEPRSDFGAKIRKLVGVFDLPPRQVLVFTGEAWSGSVRMGKPSVPL